MFLFLIIPSYHTFGENAIVGGKITIFSKVEIWWHLVTSILTWPENNLRKSLKSCRSLSNAVYWLSLSRVFLLDNMGRASEAPPPHSVKSLFVPYLAKESVSMNRNARLFWATGNPEKMSQSKWRHPHLRHSSSNPGRCLPTFFLLSAFR